MPCDDVSLFLQVGNDRILQLMVEVYQASSLLIMEIKEVEKVYLFLMEIQVFLKFSLTGQHDALAVVASVLVIKMVYVHQW